MGASCGAAGVLFGGGVVEELFLLEEAPSSSFRTL